MEACARNLRGVQQFSALSSIESNERRWFGIVVDEEVICPKPRRPLNIYNPIPELVKPRRQRSTTPRSGEAGFELLDIFLSQSSYGEASSFGCSPPYFSGSPPVRAGNPLVHDSQFMHQKTQPSPTPIRPQQSLAREKPRGVTSPCIRVEGFASSGTDTCCSVSALA